MDINELNAKLVSELREIAKLIGISDAEKLRKQELIQKIISSGDESNEPAEVLEDAASEPAAAEERPRKRTRTVKVAEPVSFRPRKEETQGEEAPRAYTESAKRP